MDQKLKKSSSKKSISIDPSASNILIFDRHAIVNPVSLRPHLNISLWAGSQAAILHEHAHSRSDRTPSNPASLSVRF